MKIKKTTLYFLGIFALIVIAGYFMIGNSASATYDSVGSNGNSAGTGGSVQKVVIGMKNYNYYPNTIKVKVGQPVSISLDDSVYGCFRSFTIREFGLSKYLRTSQETLDFTPDRKGTFRFSCSMGMGTGTLIVE